MSSSKSTEALEEAAEGATLSRLWNEHQHFIKYLIIGGSASALDVILFLVLNNQFGFTSTAAQWISVSTSVVYSFLINARHNFKTNDHMWLRLFSFCMVALLGLLVGWGIILFTESQGWVLDFGQFIPAMSGFVIGSSDLGKFISLPFVFVLQFVLNSKITFMKTREQTVTVNQ